MNIALIGYGKMGKAIETIAIERGHTVSLKIDISNLDQFTTANLQQCNVAIEFTIEKYKKYRKQFNRKGHNNHNI